MPEGNRLRDHGHPSPSCKSSQRSCQLGSACNFLQRSRQLGCLQLPAAELPSRLCLHFFAAERPHASRDLHCDSCSYRDSRSTRVAGPTSRLASATRDPLVSRDLHRDSSPARVAAPTPQFEYNSRCGTYTAIRDYLASRDLHRDSTLSRVAGPTQHFEAISRRGTYTANQTYSAAGVLLASQCPTLPEERSENLFRVRPVFCFDIV